MIFLIFMIGILAGFVDSTVGSGGLISPFLIFLGLPPQVAIATDRLGIVGQTLAAPFKFNRAKKIVWKYVPFLTILAFTGSLLGANILININQNVFNKIIGLVLFFSLLFIFIKKNIGIEQTKTTNVKRIAGFIFYFFLMIFAGFFGAGAGPFFAYVLMFFFGFTIIETKATDIIPWIILSISSLIIFSFRGLVNWNYGIILFIGMATGGYLSAHITLKIGDKWIRRLFIGIIIFSGIKLLFF